jgi:hypothetical protein
VPINARSSRFVTIAAVPFCIRAVISSDHSKVDMAPGHG